VEKRNKGTHCSGHKIIKGKRFKICLKVEEVAFSRKGPRFKVPIGEASSARSAACYYYSTSQEKKESFTGRATSQRELAVDREGGVPQTINNDVFDGLSFCKGKGTTSKRFLCVCEKEQTHRAHLVLCNCWYVRTSRRSDNLKRGT